MALEGDFGIRFSATTQADALCKRFFGNESGDADEVVRAYRIGLALLQSVMDSCPFVEEWTLSVDAERQTVWPNTVIGGRSGMTENEFYSYLRECYPGGKTAENKDSVFQVKYDVKFRIVRQARYPEFLKFANLYCREFCMKSESNKWDVWYFAAGEWKRVANFPLNQGSLAEMYSAFFGVGTPELLSSREYDAAVGRSRVYDNSPRVSFLVLCAREPSWRATPEFSEMAVVGLDYEDWTRYVWTEGWSGKRRSKETADDVMVVFRLKPRSRKFWTADAVEDYVLENVVAPLEKMGPPNGKSTRDCRVSLVLDDAIGLDASGWADYSKLVKSTEFKEGDGSRDDPYAPAKNAWWFLCLGNGDGTFRRFPPKRKNVPIPHYDEALEYFDGLRSGRLSRR